MDFIKDAERKREKLRDGSLAILVLGIIITFTDMYKVVFSANLFYEPTFMGSLISFLRIFAPILLISGFILIYFTFRLLSELRYNYILLQGYSKLKPKRISQIDVDKESVVLVVGDIVSPSYESYFFPYWLVFAHGTFFKLQSTTTGQSPITLSTYTIPEKLLREGILCKDELGETFYILFEDEDTLVSVLEKLKGENLAKEQKFSTLEDKDFERKVSYSKYKHLLTVRTTLVESVDPLYLKEIYVPSDSRRIVVIGTPLRVNGKFIVKLSKEKSHVRISPLSISIPKFLSKVVFPYKTLIRRLERKVRMLLVGVVLLWILAVIDHVMIWYLSR